MRLLLTAERAGGVDCTFSLLGSPQRKNMLKSVENIMCQDRSKMDTDGPLLGRLICFGMADMAAKAWILPDLGPASATTQPTFGSDRGRGCQCQSCRCHGHLPPILFFSFEVAWSGFFQKDGKGCPDLARSSEVVMVIRSLRTVRSWVTFIGFKTGSWK